MNGEIHHRLGALAGIAALAVALPLLAAWAADSKEEKVKLEDCPKTVQKAIDAHSQGGKVIEVEKETGKDGKVVYEAEVKKPDGKKFDVKVAEDGALIGRDDDDENDENADEDDGEDEDADDEKDDK